MLRKLKETITQEAEQERETVHKHVCYCKHEQEALRLAIRSAEDKIPAMQTELQEIAGSIASLDNTVKQQQSELKEAQDAFTQVKLLRDQEEALFRQTSAQLSAAVNALGKAIAALEKGKPAAFIQGGEGLVLRGLVKDPDIEDRVDAIESHGARTLLQFLNGAQTADLNEALGICRQLKKGMERDLELAVQREAKSKSNFEALMKSKQSDKEAAEKLTKDSTAQAGSLAVKTSTTKAELVALKESLDKNRIFLKQLETGCRDAAAEWERRKQYRASELEAIRDAIGFLSQSSARQAEQDWVYAANTDSSSNEPRLGFLQVAVSQRSRRATAAAAAAARRARSRLHSRRTGRRLHGRSAPGIKAVDFSKVVKLIDGTLAELQKAQDAETREADYCRSELEVTGHQRGVVQDEMVAMNTAIQDKLGAIKLLQGDIQALVASIKEQDEQAGKATTQRRAEHAEYQALVLENRNALDLIEMARARLAQVYQGKGTSALEVEVDAGSSSDDGDDQPRQPDGSLATRPQDKGRGDTVVKLMTKIQNDLKKEMADAESAEKDAQADYEALMQAAAARHAADAQRLVELEAARASAELRVSRLRGEETNINARKSLLDKYLKELHAKCDGLLATYEQRKAFRDSEAASLRTARKTLEVMRR